MAGPSIPDQFFTLTSFASVGGCSLFIWVIVNGVRTFFGFSPKWLVLLVSAFVVISLFLASKQAVTPLAIGALVGNIFVVALAALGLQEGAVHGVTPSVQGEEQAQSKKPWFSSWLA